MINFSALSGTDVAATPFPYMAAQHVLDPAQLAEISRDFPDIRQPGVFAPSDLSYGTAFARLIEDIEGDALRGIMEQKFGVELGDKPLMITVRGMCQKKDGRIHTDSTDKVLTCLLYLNDGGWNGHHGCLRLLRDGKNLDDAIIEVPPVGGNFVAFLRTDNSWHGHEPFEGQRRYVMFNWLRSNAALVKNVGRHKLSAAFKRIGIGDYYQ